MAAAQPGLGWQLRNRDTRVHGDHALTVGQKRIEIEFAYLWYISCKLREFDQDERDGVLISSRHVAVSL